MDELLNIFFKAFWCGCAAVGFGVLFNVPRNNLALVWIGGLIVGLIKFSFLQYVSASIIPASFLAALIVGIYAVIMANMRHEAPMIFAIPSVIPLVPGVFAYRTMLGMIKLSGNVSAEFSKTLSETAHNAAVTLFIVLAFTIGIIIPIQLGKELSKNP